MAFRFPSFFRFSPFSSLGVDIGSSTIKMVEIRRARRFWELANYGLFSLESYRGVSGNRILGREGEEPSFTRLQDTEISEIIRAIVAESGMRERQAAFSVPASASFFVVIDFPSIPESEIRKAIPHQAREFIPIALREVVLDSKILPPIGGPQMTAERIPVLLVAVPKEIISRVTRIAKLSNLDLTYLEVETFSLVRSVLGKDPASTLLIDIGGTNTTISIVSHGEVYLSHNIDIAGDDITRSVASSLGIDTRRAAELKKKFGMSARGAEREVSDSVFSIIDKIAHEMGRVLTASRQKWGVGATKFVITGGSADLPGLTNYLVERFGTEIIRGNPLHEFLYPQVLSPLLGELGSIFSVAVGLGLGKKR